jgi:hypothetical protein
MSLSPAALMQNMWVATLRQPNNMNSPCKRNEAVATFTLVKQKMQGGDAMHCLHISVQTLRNDILQQAKVGVVTLVDPA